MLNKLTDDIIKRDLLKTNLFITIVVICTAFLFMALTNFIIGVSVSLTDNESADIALLTTGIIGVAMILIALLFAVLMNAKRAYTERKSILAEEYTVVTDTCTNIEKNTVDDDGPVTEYTWHFANTNSKISRYEHNISFDEYNSINFILVFPKGESQPALFYNADKYYYEKSV